MLTHIILSIIIVTLAGLAFAFTSHKLGRGDKRIGCGAGKCGACNSENQGQSCPNEDQNLNGDSQEENDTDQSSFLDAMPDNRRDI